MLVKTIVHALCGVYWSGWGSYRQGERSFTPIRWLTAASLILCWLRGFSGIMEIRLSAEYAMPRPPPRHWNSVVCNAVSCDHGVIWGYIQWHGYGPVHRLIRPVPISRSCDIQIHVYSTIRIRRKQPSLHLTIPSYKANVCSDVYSSNMNIYMYMQH